MGAYLSSPILDKVSSDETSDRLSYGASSMQGWRVSQEDAHNCILDFDTDTSLFAVYDGHGGAEVAKYCSLNLPDYLRSVTDYKEGKINKALEETFLQFDSTLTKPEVIVDLKRFADLNSSGDESDDDPRTLNEEAHMPLEEVLARYSNCPDKEPEPDIDSAGCSASSSGSGSGSSRPKLNVPKRLAPHLIRYHDQKPKSPMLHAKKSFSKTSESDSSAGKSEIITSVSKDIDSVESASSKTENVKIQNDSAVASSEADGDGESKVDTSDTRTINNLNGVSSSVKSGSEVLPSTNPCTKEANLQDDGCNSVDSSDFAKPINKPLITPSSTDSKTDTESGEDGVSSTTLNGESGKKLDCDEDNGQPSCSSVVSSSSVDGTDKKINSDNLWPTSNENESSSDEESGEDEDYEGTDSDSSGEKLDDDDTTDEEEEDENLNPDNEEMEVNLADSELPGQDSGCTAVVALLRGNELYVANAGDSRCILCRDGKAIEMSFDHKPEDDIERERIINAGGKVTNDGRVNGGLNLSRAIGDHVYKSNARLPLRDQMITALPDIKQITVDTNKDQFIILACDGIWNYMSSQEVVDFVYERIQKAEKLSTICEELFDNCLAPNTEGDGTGCDNMTAIVVRLNEHLKSQENLKKRPIEDGNEGTEGKMESKKAKIEETF